MAAPDLSRRSLGELTSLGGRAAVITGGARGLGLAIGRRFAEAGATIALADLDGMAAHTAANQLASEFAVEAIGVEVDVRDGRAVASLASTATSQLGAIDIWVNNAGIFPVGPLLETRDGDWDRVVGISLRGAYLGAKEAARRMIDQDRSGVIINMSSVAGLKGRPNFAHYTAAKHGLLGLTKALAAELGPDGIRVLAIAPTLTETPGTLRQRAEGGPEVEELERSIAAAMPLGRAGVPDDVARVALFCASDLAGLLTGTHLLVDAGEQAT